MKKLTVAALRRALAALKPGDDDREIVVWLPGSIIDLSDNGGAPFLRGTPTAGERTLMLEGNVRRGSALDTES